MGLRFKLEINADNAAFVTDSAGELRVALANTAQLVQDGLWSGIVRDSNGNTVGEWSFAREADDT